MNRKLNFVRLIALIIAQIKPKSAVSNTASLTSNKPRHPMVQTFNINNWGFEDADRKLLSEIKYKVDSLYEKSATTVCPQDGWVHYGNFSYLVIDIPTLKWSDARRTCEILGGDLAIVRSAAENNFIFDLIKKQKTITNWGVWLGLVRKADTKFYWIDDTPMANGYTAWLTGKPDSVSQKCAHMYGTGGGAGKWDDVYCDNSPSYFTSSPVILCKKKKITKWLTSIRQHKIQSLV